MTRHGQHTKCWPDQRQRMGKGKIEFWEGSFDDTIVVSDSSVIQRFPFVFCVIVRIARCPHSMGSSFCLINHSAH